MFWIRPLYIEMFGGSRPILGVMLQPKNTTTFFLAASVLSLSCSAPKNFERVEQTEYAVYSQLMNDILESIAPLPIGNIMILDSTVSIDKDREPFRNYAVVASGDSVISYQLSEETRSDFISKNNKRYHLEDKFNFPVPHQMLSGVFLDSIFDYGGWDAFYGHYPKSKGYLTISRVGFNREKTEALLYIENRSGDLSGNGSFVIMRKDRGKWVQVCMSRIWVS